MVELLACVLDHQAGHAVGTCACTADDGGPGRRGEGREDGFQPREYALLHQPGRVWHIAFSHKLLNQIGHGRIEAQEQDPLAHSGTPSITVGLRVCGDFERCSLRGTLHPTGIVNNTS